MHAPGIDIASELQKHTATTDESIILKLAENVYFLVLNVTVMLVYLPLPGKCAGSAYSYNIKCHCNVGIPDTL